MVHKIITDFNELFFTKINLTIKKLKEIYKLNNIKNTLLLEKLSNIFDNKSLLNINKDKTDFKLLINNNTLLVVLKKK